MLIYNDKKIGCFKLQTTLEETLCHDLQQIYVPNSLRRSALHAPLVVKTIKKQ
jgi:hypothetical protein